jgi:hypothetical protein
MPDISMESFTLGTIICRFKVPLEVIDEINKDYDNAKDLPAHNQNLAGKIADEFKVTDILSENTRALFTTCFRQYLQTIKKPFWHVSLENAWINDMKANEYNPFHFHTSPMTDLGLSSVLMLKKPSTYGKEYSREESPSNGMLEFTGGQQDPLSIPQNRVDAKVGELYVFPYTLLHGVYPFNGTDEIRRTLSYNCNLYKPAVVQQVRDQQMKEADNA